MKALITTVPFAENNRLPLDLLESAGIEYLINPLEKKLVESELISLLADFDVIIAGTETITKEVMSSAANLKFISRVGIGLDSVDLLSAEELGIKVSYTPDAPAPAVAELAMGLILSLLRSVHVSNMQLHNGYWHRYFGRRLSECVVGVIGVGRVGRCLLNHLSGFNCKKVLLNDLEINSDFTESMVVEWVDKETIYREADIISLHVPLTKKTRNMVCKEQLEMMKSDAVLINTARGGIINERDLYSALKAGHLSGVAIDVFEQEPYSGNLSEIDRCLLTAHMGSMSIDCRSKMELLATKEVIRFFNDEPLLGLVPEDEYIIQRMEKVI